MHLACRAALRSFSLRIPLLATLLLAALAAPAAALKLNELRPWSGNTGVGDPTDDFPNLVELYNESGSTQNVSGWHLGGATGADQIALPSWSVPAGAYLTVVFGAGVDDSDFSDGSGTYHTGVIAWTLTPDAGEVGLYDGAPAPGTIVDFVSYGVAAGSFGDAYNHALSAGQWSASQFVDLSGQSIFAHVSRIPSGYDSDAITDWSEMEAAYLTESSPHNSIQLAPRDGTLQENLANYVWRALAAADSYYVEVASDSLFATLVESIIIDSSIYTPPSTLGDGVYFWRVRPFIGGTLRDPAARWVFAKTNLSISPEKWRHNRTNAPVGLVYSLVPQFFQHKDSGLLCIWNARTGRRMGCTEAAGAAGPWDAAHPIGNHILNCPHCGMYCTRAAIQMINARFGGSLLQDEISYNLKNGNLAGPEGDLGHNVGAWASENNTYSWALSGTAAPEVINGAAPIPWAALTAMLDANRPVLAAIAPPGILHSVVITGYFEFFGFRWIHITDPWPARTGWYFWSRMPVVRYYNLPLTGAIAGRAADPKAALDSDGDGVVDFDENDPRPFHSDKAKPDTDLDGVPDKADIGMYTFHPVHHPLHNANALSFADWDGDGSRAENDCDSDNDGDYDGGENIDADTRNVEAGETCAFNSAVHLMNTAITSVIACGGGLGEPQFAGGTLQASSVFNVDIRPFPCIAPPLLLALNVTAHVSTDANGNIAAQLSPCFPPGTYLAIIDLVADGKYTACDRVMCFTVDAATPALAISGLEAGSGPGARIAWWSGERTVFDAFRVLRAARGGEPVALAGAVVANEAPSFPARLGFEDLSAREGVEYDYWVEGVKAGAEPVRIGPVTLRVAGTPRELALHHPEPNPFGATASFAVDVPRQAGPISLVVYDLAGRRVRTLHSGALEPGQHRLVWNGRDDRGDAVRPGIYLARLAGAAGVRTVRVVKTP